MRRRRLTFLTLLLMLGAAALAACGSDSGIAEPVAAPAESVAEPEADEADNVGAPGDTGDAQTENNAAGQPKLVEFYADW